MDDRVATLIRQGQSAAQDGNLEMARNYLQAAVDLDRTNPTAWLWLAGVLEEPTQVRNALEQVLMLDPSNERAEQGLAHLNSQYPPAPIFAEEPMVPDPMPTRAAGTGMLGDTTAGTMTIEQQLRSQLPPPSSTPTSGTLAPVGVNIYDNPAPTGNYVRPTGQNDMPFRVAVMSLSLLFLFGLCVFGLVLLRIV
jgi:hypothetical protein